MATINVRSHVVSWIHVPQVWRVRKLLNVFIYIAALCQRELNLFMFSHSWQDTARNTGIHALTHTHFSTGTKKQTLPLNTTVARSHTRASTYQYTHTHASTHTHTCTHTHAPTHIRTHVRTPLRQHTYAHMYARPCANTHTHTCTHAHAPTHIRTHVRTPMRQHTYAHMYARPCANTHTHTCTHAHVSMHKRKALICCNVDTHKVGGQFFGMDNNVPLRTASMTSPLLRPGNGSAPNVMTSQTTTPKLHMSDFRVKAPSNSDSRDIQRTGNGAR